MFCTIYLSRKKIRALLISLLLIASIIFTVFTISKNLAAPTLNTDGIPVPIVMYHSV